MKKLIFVILILIFLVGCDDNEVNFAQTQSKKEETTNKSQEENKNEKITGNTSENKETVQKSSKHKPPKWKAGNYKGLQLGKSTLKDVERIFGKPKYIYHPEDEYDNPIESKLDYIYENEPQIIIDKKTRIVEEIWGGDFSTFDEAIKKYGNDFYEVEFTHKGCVFKEYKETQPPQKRLNIAYPQYGFYFYLDDERNVIAIYYVHKCG